MSNLERKVQQLRARSFGTLIAWHEDIELSCNAIVPGLSLHDLTMAFDRASKEGDEWAGNPSEWPTVRGVSAVVEAVLKSLDQWLAAPSNNGKQAGRTMR